MTEESSEKHITEGTNDSLKTYGLSGLGDLSPANMADNTASKKSSEKQSSDKKK